MEPLLASEESGGVERTLDELETSGELGPYLKAALRSEQILLNRKPDLERAQEVHLDRGEPMRFWYTLRRVGRKTAAIVYGKSGDLAFVARRIAPGDKVIVESGAKQTVTAYRAVEALPWCHCGRRHALDNYCPPRAS